MPKYKIVLVNNMYQVRYKTFADTYMIYHTYNSLWAAHKGLEELKSSLEENVVYQE